MLYTSISEDLPPVSRLSLGSWNTFSRLGTAECSALLRHAVELGINLFDIGYYWDKPGTEEQFAAAVRASGIARRELVLGLKLWLWDYPKMSLAEQAHASMRRLSTDYLDMVMVSRPTPEVDAIGFCEEIGTLVSTGIARTWCATNWEPAHIALARRTLPPSLWPCMVQLQYNVARRDIVESADFSALFCGSNLRLCAAFVLEGGILAGHLDRDRVDPSRFARGERPPERNIARDAGGIRAGVRAIQPRLNAISATLDATAAQLAIAFTLANPATATTLVGVTRLHDLGENVNALKLLPTAAQWLPLLEPLRVHGSSHPRLFDPVRRE